MKLKLKMKIKNKNENENKNAPAARELTTLRSEYNDSIHWGGLFDDDEAGEEGGETR